MAISTAANKPSTGDGSDGDFRFFDSATETANGNIQLGWHKEGGDWQQVYLPKSDSNTLTNVIFETTGTLAGGGSSGVSVTADPSEVREVKRVENKEPGNDHGYEITEVFYDTSDGSYRINYQETQNAGGGQYRVIVWQIEV